MQEKIQKESKKIREVDWDFLYALSIFFQNPISSLFACLRDDKKKDIAVNGGL
jgi:hypothetical protein